MTTKPTNKEKRVIMDVGLCICFAVVLSVGLLVGYQLGFTGSLTTHRKEFQRSLTEMGDHELDVLCRVHADKKARDAATEATP